MKAFLLHEARDFAWRREPDPGHDDLVQDLGVETVLAAMAAGDRFIFNVSQQVLLTSVPEPDEIRFRQAVLQDCIANTDAIHELYTLAVDAIGSERKMLFGFGLGSNTSPGMIVSRAVQLLELLVAMLRQLRAFSDTHNETFASDGFRRFHAMIAEELSDEYLQSLDEHLKQLTFRRGVLMSAHLGKANKGAGYLLRRAQNVPRGVRARLATAVTRAPGYSFQIADRDEAGARALGELRDRGLNSVANAAAQSSDHVLSFFRMLRAELGFYIGCLNLRDTLTARGEPTTFPDPTAAKPPTLAFRNLRDAGLALRTGEAVVGNDVDADDKTLIIITGANQGGKSTFLRSLGLAQLMMQAGMFVVADTFRASVCSGVMTHFVREEDATMTSGKLDEELARMNELAERLAPRTLMLFNESFSATNEREGSEIARQIIRALRDAHIRVVFVTHMYDLAHGFYTAGDHSILFLRAQRLEDERRTFKLVEAEPERTSHGEDLYHRIFDAPNRHDNSANGGRHTPASQSTPA